MPEWTNYGPQFKFFYQISQIPRGSFNEKEVVDYIQRFAEERGLEYTRDELGNMIIRKPASPGREDEPALALQAHTDMVCNKVPGSKHDFTKDPIDIIEEDGWLTANGTTLGADDGAGVANILALLDDDTLSHPMLECILTVQEEDGMGGAKAIDLSSVTARRMIGLDGILEGSTIYSASAVRGCHFSTDMGEANGSDPCYKLEVSGLTSGHGALLIGSERANAIKLTAEILRAISRVSDVKLVSVKGGGLIHVIPGSCESVFACAADFDTIEKIVADKLAYLKVKYQDSDPGMHMIVTPVNASGARVSSAEGSLRVIRFIELLPVGALKRDPDDLSLVSGSFNLSIIDMKDRRLDCDMVCRSNWPVDVEELFALAGDYAELSGMDMEKTIWYAGYHVPIDSPLILLWADVYREATGKELIVQHLHSGLDAGEISEKLGLTDMIVMMPTTPDVHTPNERVGIESWKNTYKWLREIIERC